MINPLIDVHSHLMLLLNHCYIVHNQFYNPEILCCILIICHPCSKPSASIVFYMFNLSMLAKLDIAKKYKNSTNSADLTLMNTIIISRGCTGLTEPAFQLLTAEVYAEWVCDKCLHSKNIPLVKFKP